MARAAILARGDVRTSPVSSGERTGTVERTKNEEERIHARDKAIEPTGGTGVARTSQRGDLGRLRVVVADQPDDHDSGPDDDHTAAADHASGGGDGLVRGVTQ
jgi:hypothetical protein